MKTFADLVFTPHPANPQDGKCARMEFENGYGISVIRLPSPFGHILPRGMRTDLSYTQGLDSWEVATLKRNESGRYDIAEVFESLESVIGFCSQTRVTWLMEKIQALAPVGITPQAMEGKTA